MVFRSVRSLAAAAMCSATICVVVAVCGTPVFAQTPPQLVARIAKFPLQDPDALVVALTAVADDLPFAAEDEREAAVAALRRLAAEERFYSPAATQPTFAWFQYERALRRAEVGAAGDDPAALQATLQHLLDRRAGILPMMAALGRGNQAPPDVHDLTRFGWHGAGEVLEAVADLATRRGIDARGVGAELAKYLVCEQPHPLTPHLEGAAGCGETPPTDTPARQFAIQWGDGYRIALARAVLATGQPATDQEIAVLHLLYSPRRADRLDAVARLRGKALADVAVGHLVAQLGDMDHLVVREVIGVLAVGGEAAKAARPALQALADGDDRELRAIAARALERLDGR